MKGGGLGAHTYRLAGCKAFAWKQQALGMMASLQGRPALKENESWSLWVGGLPSWGTMHAFGGLWVVYRETLGRGSQAISAGPQVCLSWPRCYRHRSPNVHPGSSPFAFRPNPATRCMGTFSGLAGVHSDSGIPFCRVKIQSPLFTSQLLGLPPREGARSAAMLSSPECHTSYVYPSVSLCACKGTERVMD